MRLSTLQNKISQLKAFALVFQQCNEKKNEKEDEDKNNMVFKQLE